MEFLGLAFGTLGLIFGPLGLILEPLGPILGHFGVKMAPKVTQEAPKWGVQFRLAIWDAIFWVTVVHGGGGAWPSTAIQLEEAGELEAVPYAMHHGMMRRIIIQMPAAPPPPCLGQNKGFVHAKFETKIYLKSLFLGLLLFLRSRYMSGM